MGGGSKTVPAGKCLAHLSLNTIDRQNLSTASWTVTAAGKSYTAEADATGRADILVDSGVTYTATLTHQGEYYNDAPQTFVANSTGVVWIYFDLFQYPDIKTVVQVYTDAGTTVVGTSGSNSMSVVADSNGLAQFNGLATGSVWTFTANGDSVTVTIDRLLKVVEVGKTIVYGVMVYRNTSSPSARVEYIDDAAGFTPIVNSGGTFDMGSWKGCGLIENIKPVAKSGSVWTDLDKRTLSGCPSSTSGDALVEVPTWWLSIKETSTAITIRFSNRQVDSTFQKYASRFGGEDVGMFHIGMFHGVVSSSKLYSYSGATPTVNTSITNFINYAKARGSGYDIAVYYQMTYLTALMTLLFRSTDGQSSLGRGHVSSGSAAASRSKLAFTNSYGMYGKTDDSTVPVAFFWIHDFWGNVLDFIGCAKTDSSRRLMTIIDGGSSVTESDFKLVSPATPTGSRSGYVSDVVGTTEAGFLPKTCSGSSSTFWCDYGYVYASCFPFFGGFWGYGGSAGPFRWYFDCSASEAYSGIGSRLSYRAGRA